MSENGWSEHKLYVTKELESQKKTNGEQWDEITNLKIEQTKLKIKAGVWGALGAAIPVILGLLIFLLRRLLLS